MAKVLGSAADATVLSTDPFILLFEQFATPSEVEQLVDTMAKRCSANSRNRQWAHPRRKRPPIEPLHLLRHAALLRGTHCAQSDGSDRSDAHAGGERQFLQLLRYDVEQYRIHHDFIGGGDVGGAGGRVYSFVLFLSDTEEGGELHFADVILQLLHE